MNLNKKIEIPVKPHQDGIKTIGSMMSASVALILGSCAPLESLSFQDYNAETQTQNALLNYQPIDEILAGKSPKSGESFFPGLLESLQESAKKSQEFVDDYGNMVTWDELESSNQ